MQTENINQPFVPSINGVQNPRFFFIPMEATAVVRLNKLDLNSLTDKVKMKDIFGDEDLTRFLAIVNAFRTQYPRCIPNMNSCMETPFPWELTTKLYDSPYFETIYKDYVDSVEKKVKDLAKAASNNEIVTPTPPKAEELYKISPLNTNSCYLVEIHEDFIIALKDRDIEFKFISDCLKVLCKELPYETVASHYLMFNGYVKSIPCLETV